MLSEGFPCGSAGKESSCNAGDLGSIPGLGRSPGEGKGYALQYSGLENSMNCIVHGVAKSQTWLSDFHSLTHSCSLRLGKQSYLPEFTQLGDKARVQTPAPLIPDFVTPGRGTSDPTWSAHSPTIPPAAPAVPWEGQLTLLCPQDQQAPERDESPGNSQDVIHQENTRPSTFCPIHLFFFFLAALRGLWDLSSLNRH